MRHGLWLVVVAGLLLPACGGGGGGGGAPGVPAAGAQVLGVVTSSDGSSANLDGIQILLPETGDVAWTDGTGAFRLRAPAGIAFRVRFRDPRGPSRRVGDDVSEREDETPDADDIDGDHVEVGPLDVDEVCEIEVELEDGEVIEAWIARKHEDREDHGGESRLCPPEGRTEGGPRGEAEIDHDDGCLFLEIEVEGLEASTSYDVQLWHPEGDELSLGTLEVDAEGEGHFGAEWCEDDALPFEAPSKEDLAGIEIVIVDGAGTVALRGRLPGRGKHHDDREHPRILWELVAPDTSPEPEAEGVVLVTFKEDCLRAVIEVGHVYATDTLDVVLARAEADDILLGTMEIDAQGMGRLVLELCDEDDLPEIPVEDPADAFGLVLELRNPEGAVVLLGEVPEIELPELPPFDPPSIGDAELEAPEGSPDPDAEGVLLVVSHEMGEALTMRVFHVESVEVADVVLTCEGEDATLGEMEFDERGKGWFVFEVGETTELPFEAASLTDYAGCVISVRDGDGTVIVAGEMPELETAKPDFPPGGGGLPFPR